MTMNASAPPELCDSTRPERVKALEQFAFTERQARFLVNVLLHSGVFLERQYCRFAGITHGRKAYEFLRTLVDRKYVTVAMPGKLHSGRLFHVQYKPLYEAVGEPDNRNRRSVALGRLIERLMLLDVLLADTRHTWLATEKDKLAYVRARQLWASNNNDDAFPRLAFGEGADGRLPQSVRSEEESREGKGGAPNRPDGPPACCEHANDPDQPVERSNRRGCRGSCHSPPSRKAAAMNDDEKAVIDEIANSLQVINLLSTQLRRDLGESAQHAIDLEGATARAVRAMKRLQPDGKKKR